MPRKNQVPASTIPSADEISPQEFKHVLARYPSVIEAVSSKKGAKRGQETLAELDQYRYDEVTQSLKGGSRLALDEVTRLVQWKLRHGKFRPTLVKLVSSNDPPMTSATIARALELYRDKANIPGALAILCELKGIGPATASLLLAVHDPDRIVFFGDEVFHWLLCDGKAQSPRYNAKEYEALHDKATVVASRLSATMVQIEKVAFVLMNQDQQNVAEPVHGEATSSKRSKKSSSSQSHANRPKPAPAAKRKKKDTSDNETGETKLRRSKRGRNSVRT